MKYVEVEKDFDVEHKTEINDTTFSLTAVCLLNWTIFCKQETKCEHKIFQS